MANSNIKSLTLAEIQKVNKKMDAQKTIYVELEGKKFKVTIDEHFRKSKQASLLDDIVKFMATVDDKGSLDLSVEYMKLLMIKHFTSLEIPDNVVEAIKVLRMFVDLDLIDTIVDAMPEEEQTKMMELIAKNVNGLNNLYDDILEHVENEEIKEVMLGE